MTIRQSAVCLTITHQKSLSNEIKMTMCRMTMRQMAIFQTTISKMTIYHMTIGQMTLSRTTIGQMTICKMIQVIQGQWTGGFLVFVDLSFGTPSSTCWGVKTLIFMADCHSAGWRLADCRGTIESLAEQNLFPNVDKVSMLKRFGDFWSKTIWPTDNWSTPS